MSRHESLGFSYQRCSFTSRSDPNVKRAVFRAKKMLEGIVYDTVALEGNPFTFPEVKTLIEGITVGGHRVEDANQVLNQAKSWRRLFHLVENERSFLSEDTATELHALVAREEAPAWGVFRDGPVGVGGTKCRPPPHEELPALFKEGTELLSEIADPHERGMCAFLFGSLHQFFWDGNRRTARLMMNGILLSEGYDAISIPAASRLEFNKRMVTFYDTKDATAMMSFLAECSLDGTLRLELIGWRQPSGERTLDR